MHKLLWICLILWIRYGRMAYSEQIHSNKKGIDINYQVQNRLQPGGNQRQGRRNRHFRDFQRQDKEVGIIDIPITVELAIIVDETFYNYHGNDTERYVLTVMGQVQDLWHAPSLGANVTLQINRLIILDHQPKDLTPDENADSYLKRLCDWKKHLSFLYGDPVQYDAVVLITRTDLHIGGNYEATGLGYILGACDTRHQCSVNEDTHPMGLAMTIAHEIGHNLGMWHDGFHNADVCPDRTFLMSGFSVGGPRSLIWSQCSRHAMAEFIRSSKADCLKNVSAAPVVHLQHHSQILPGYLYDADSQCRILYGKGARVCNNWTGKLLCGELRCLPSNSDRCETEKRPPLDGTKCGPNSVCLSGYCQVQPSAKSLSTPNLLNNDKTMANETQPKEYKNSKLSSLPQMMLLNDNISSNETQPKEHKKLSAHRQRLHHHIQVQDESLSNRGQLRGDDLDHFMKVYVILMIIAIGGFLLLVKKRRLCWSIVSI